MEVNEACGMDKISDQQIVKTLATEAMGWKDVIGAWNTGNDIINYGEWNPLENIVDAWMIVIKLIKDGFGVNVLGGGIGFGFDCEIYEFTSCASMADSHGKTAQKAICLSTYKLVTKQGRN